MRTCPLVLAALAWTMLVRPVVVRAQPDPSGIDFVTIGSPGNAAYAGLGSAHDRGSVGYEYKIGRFEVTTAEWVQFFNAAYDRPASDRLPHLLPPDFWGAVSTTPNTPGGLRWAVPAGNEMMPVGDISWRMAAMYANWLHNNKSTDRSAFLSGAYDVSTFRYVGNGFADQPTRSPGARYWIPSWDEWIKASHFDPNKANPDGTRGGWWTYSNGTDQPLTAGAPPSMGGMGQANYGFERDHGVSAFSIPLGAYSAVTSPWGLYDVAGGAAEWTEEILTGNEGTMQRVHDGSYWGSAPGYRIADHIGSFGSDFPSIGVSNYGLRIAAAVPTPGACVLGAAVAVLCSRRRKGRQHDGVSRQDRGCGHRSGVGGGI